jgi:VIT family
MIENMATEKHYTDKSGWLRAAVLGANDGILSTTSLVIGVAAASATRSPIILAALAGLAAGALSMAAGEYVSVSSQSDIESAELKREQIELDTMPEEELKELAGLYQNRGLDNELAMQVAVQLSKKNVLEAHTTKTSTCCICLGDIIYNGWFSSSVGFHICTHKIHGSSSIFIFNRIPGILGCRCSESRRVRNCKKCIKDLFLGNHRNGSYCGCGIFVWSKDTVKEDAYLSTIILEPHFIIGDQNHHFTSRKSYNLHRLTLNFT